MKLKIPISIVAIVAVVAFFAFSQSKRKAFAAAEDFPRGALVYLQISDLPAFIKLWNESNFKEKYTASENFKDISKRHLGLKLASRWQEFNEAAGFPIDFAALAGLTENRAAIALYDVGKLEFVFVAPVSEELFAATKFVQNQANFTEETLADGTIIYRAKIAADRGRQNQELIFTNAKGRFVLATSEKLLAATLTNINGDKTKNRLSDEPSFQLLSEKTETHAATVWVNQQVLNDDYYFKRYWLMADAENLKNIRAGVFDFEMQDEKFVERRKFLLDQKIDSAPVTPKETAEMISRLPADIPFYSLQSANAKTIDAAIEKTIFPRRRIEPKQKSRQRSYYSSFSDYDDSSYHDYDSLDETFDETIDEADENEQVERREIDIDFAKLLQAANPRAVLTFTEPEILTAPLFVEFRHAAVFRLASPAAFNPESFEAAIEKNLLDKVSISAPGAKLSWETKSENDASWRELQLPMLEWKIIYLLRGNELILTDNAEFLTEIPAERTSPAEEKQTSAFDKLSVLNLEQRENAYYQIFAELPEENVADDFFMSNVKSLLEAAPEIKKISIKELYSQNFIDEEITVNLK
ncbi:MAG TPA: hypothetical protein VGC76_04585 [Pyrinomonadaceae bacterium]|jgi:hypothetical protein